MNINALDRAIRKPRRTSDTFNQHSVPVAVSHRWAAKLDPPPVDQPADEGFDDGRMSSENAHIPLGPWPHQPVTVQAPVRTTRPRRSIPWPQRNGGDEESQ